MKQDCKTAILHWECPVTRGVFTVLALCLYARISFCRLNVTYRTGANQMTGKPFWGLVLFRDFPASGLNFLTAGAFYALWTLVLLLICYPLFFSRNSTAVLRARFGGVNAALPLFSAAALSVSLWQTAAAVRGDSPIRHAVFLLSAIPFLWAIPLCVWLCRHQLKARLRTPRQLVRTLLPAVPLLFYNGIFACYALYNVSFNIDLVGLWQTAVPVICAGWAGATMLRTA